MTSKRRAITGTFIFLGIVSVLFTPRIFTAIGITNTATQIVIFVLGILAFVLIIFMANEILKADGEKVELRRKIMRHLLRLDYRIEKVDYGNSIQYLEWSNHAAEILGCNPEEIRKDRRANDQLGT